MGLRVAALAAMFSCAALVLFVGGLDQVGLTWDEPPYFASAERLQVWSTRVVAGPGRVEALQPEVVEDVWDWQHYYNPHPPVYKQVMAATEALAGGWLGKVGGFRLASLLEFAALLALVVLVAARAWGRTAGAVAALALLCMPRVVGHAHIAATDMPLTLFWFAGAVGMAIGVRERSWCWGLLGAAGFGLAMGTKFTGYLLPVPLLGWAFLVRWKGHNGGGMARTLRATLRSALPRAAVFTALALALAWVMNPLAWYDPVGYVSGLFHESLGRGEAAPISTFYLGEKYSFVLPWHHAPVLTAITLPLSIVALCGIGAGATFAGLRRRPLGLLCSVQVLFFWALLALPGSPNHDGVRLFLPSFPFLALLGGFGFAAAADLLRDRVGATWRDLATVAFGAALFAPAALQVAAARPYYLAYYGELAGGAGGAAKLGMETTYWYDALTPAFLEAVNETLPQGATLATFPTTDHFLALQRYGYLRDDIRVQGVLPADYLLLYARKASFGPVQAGIYGSVRPVRAVEYKGVELAGLYAWEDEEAARDDARSDLLPQLEDSWPRGSRSFLAEWDARSTLESPP